MPSRFDKLVLPLFGLLTIGGTWLGLELGVPPMLVSTLVVAPLAVVAAILERVRPGRPEHRPLDLPLLTDLAHFLFNYNLGYLLAILGWAGLGRLTGSIDLPRWPSSWPLAAQVPLAIVLAEGASYWQHRLSHRVPWLWRFHALHHSGPRLNLLRAGRFHFVDIGPGAFLTFAPLALLSAPDEILAWTAALAGALGVIEHANLRAPAPAWLDRVICTPAVHQTHHSRDAGESDANFGTAVMLFDHLFGSYRAPRAGGPEAMGIEDDPVPRRGFWAQLTRPFRP